MSLDTEALAKAMSETINDLAIEKCSIDKRIRKVIEDSNLRSLEYEEKEISRKLSTARECLLSVQRLCEHEFGEYNSRYGRCSKCGAYAGDVADEAMRGFLE